MPSGADAQRAATQNSACSGDSLDGQKSYRVVLEDICSGIETTDSFAIKFALLTKTPISKMKHLARHVPSVIWSGRGRSTAEHVLALIEEAGGKGNIIENGEAPAVSPTGSEGAVNPAKSGPTCRWCGFPMKEGEKRCGFCMTSVGTAERSEHAPEVATRRPVLARKRFIWYAALLVGGIILIELLMR